MRVYPLGSPRVCTAHEFMQLVRQELLGTRVFIFTEKGRSTRILNLQRGATVGDAAKLLNSSWVTHAPLVGGAQASPETELKNGDLVSFVPRWQPQPAPPASAIDGTAPQTPPAAPRPPLLMETGTLAPGFTRANPAADADAVASSGGASPAPVWRMCQRCLPLPGDPLVFTSPPNAQQGPDGQMGGTLHRAACECLALRRQLAAGERCIRPSAAVSERYRSELDAALCATSTPGSRKELLTTKVVVFTRDQPGMLLSVSAVVTESSENIIDVHSITRSVGSQSAFQYKVHLSSVAQLDTLIAAIETVDGVVRVVRGDMDDMLHDSKEAFWANAES